MKVDTDKEDRGDSLKDTLDLIGVVFLVFLLWTLFAVIWFESTNRINELGQFGDSFGAINALVSTFAFMAIVLSLGQSRKTLELQREDLKLQNEEIKRSNEQFEIQINLLKYQLAMSQLPTAKLRPQITCDFDLTFHSNAKVDFKVCFTNSIENISSYSLILDSMEIRLKINENLNDSIELGYKNIVIAGGESFFIDLQSTVITNASFLEILQYFENFALDKILIQVKFRNLLGLELASTHEYIFVSDSNTLKKIGCLKQLLETLDFAEFAHIDEILNAFYQDMPPDKPYEQIRIRTSTMVTTRWDTNFRFMLSKSFIEINDTK